MVKYKEVHLCWFLNLLRVIVGINYTYKGIVWWAERPQGQRSPVDFKY